MNSAYCGVCGRQYSECICVSRPYPRSGLDSPVRVELIAVPRERLERLERVAVAAQESRGEIEYLYAGLLRHGTMPECTEAYLKASRDRLDHALQALGEGTGESTEHGAQCCPVDLEKLRCPFCSGENVNTNVAHTLFCQDCKITVSRRGKVERMHDNPLTKQFGYAIKPGNPDAALYLGEAPGEKERAP